MVGIRGRFLLGWSIFRGRLLLVLGSATWNGFLLRSFFCPKFCRCITPVKINIEPENRAPLDSRRFLLETTSFGCGNISFREGTLICNKRLENIRLCWRLSRCTPQKLTAWTPSNSWFGSMFPLFQRGIFKFHVIFWGCIP